MGEKGISRRSFLKWSAGALASVALLEFERPARAFAAEEGGAAPSQRFPPRPSRSRGSRRSSRRTWQSSMPMRRATKRAVCAQRYRACSRIYLPRHARVRRRRAGMRAQPSGQRERRGGRRALAAGGGILAGKDAVALGLLTAEGKLVAPRASSSISATMTGCSAALRLRAASPTCETTQSAHSAHCRRRASTPCATTSAAV